MARYRGKHRKPSTTRHTVARFAVAGTVVATPITVTIAGTASAANWDALAQCESSGNWAANTGNGFSGGLQFTPSTWAAYGGTRYSANAAHASREQQIEVAKRVLAAQGPGAWPVCSVKTGFTGGGGTSGTAPANPVPQESGPAESGQNENGPAYIPTTEQSPDQDANDQGDQAATYTVQPGDTLSKIGKKTGVNWHVLFARNAKKIHNANLIYPGQRLDL